MAGSPVADFFSRSSLPRHVATAVANFDLAGSATVLALGFVRTHSTPELTPLSSHLMFALARQATSLASCFPTSARCFWLGLPATSIRPDASATLRTSATGTTPAHHPRPRRDRCM